jgi:hypothetical protein
MNLKSLILFALTFSGQLLASDLKRENWHVPVREYASFDSVLVPFAEFKKIEQVQVGMLLTVLPDILGVTPVDYSIHPGYSLVMTHVDGVLYEAAFWHGKGRRVESISFRKPPEGKKGEPVGMRRRREDE